MGACTRIFSKKSLLKKYDSSSSVLPITVDEFSEVWTKIWPTSWGTSTGSKRSKPRSNTIGLAISGGVDSMALAFLCSRIKEKLSPSNAVNAPTGFRAFVVDHGVRKESRTEAEAVCESLIKRGIPSDLLTIKWPDSDPKKSSNFESAARTYRFRELGKACRRWGIESLLLAHHQDDQAETVMMRLMDGHRTGLTGIKSSSEIPECYGIHGVHESGGLDDVNLACEPIPTVTRMQNLRENKQLVTETGGVRIYRPLLGFSKERLRATCVQNSVNWFEDHTNKDQTLTKRNAIRYMFTHHRLPKALSKPSLLNLCQSMNEQKEHQQEVQQKWLEKCHITALDLGVGSMNVKFTDLDECKRGPEWPGDRAGLIAAEYLRRVIMLVCPQEHISLSALHGAVGRVFPELTGEEVKVTPFTVCGVYFQLMPPPETSNGKASEKPFLPTEGELEQEVVTGEKKLKPTWFLSRQTFPRTELSKHDITFTFPQSSQPTSTSEPPSEVTTQQWSPFTLFDNRFWIRIFPPSSPPSSRTLLIKPLTPHHWSDLRALLSKKGQQDVLKKIKARAPGNVKFTLPALVVKEGERERVLGLPSLGVFVRDKGQGQGGLKCEVRWKKIHTKGMGIRYKNEEI